MDYKKKYLKYKTKYTTLKQEYQVGGINTKKLVDDNWKTKNLQEILVLLGDQLSDEIQSVQPLIGHPDNLAYINERLDKLNKRVNTITRAMAPLVVKAINDENRWPHPLVPPFYPI